LESFKLLLDFFEQIFESAHAIRVGSFVKYAELMLDKLRKHAFLTEEQTESLFVTHVPL
jgi:hypothetical protein